jgi:hypothetical protein
MAISTKRPLAASRSPAIAPRLELLMPILVLILVGRNVSRAPRSVAARIARGPTPRKGDGASIESTVNRFSSG